MPHTRNIVFAASKAVEVSPGVFRGTFNSDVLHTVIGVSLKSAVFSNNVYNIVAPYNTLTVLTDGAHSTQITVAPGFYTAQQFADYLRPIIQVILDTYAPGAVIDLTFAPPSFVFKSTVTGATFEYAADTLNTTIGLLAAGSGLVADGDLYAFPDFPNLYGLDHVTISVASQDPQTLVNTGVGAQDFLPTNSVAMIPITVPFGGLQTYSQFNLADAMVDYRGYQNLTTIQVSIRDVDGAGIPGQADHLVVELRVYFPDRRNG